MLKHITSITIVSNNQFTFDFDKKKKEHFRIFYSVKTIFGIVILIYFHIDGIKNSVI